MSRLAHLDLSSNRFEGSVPRLPPELSYLCERDVLAARPLIHSCSRRSLANNTFGALVASDVFASLQYLGQLSLAHNRFAGSVPLLPPNLRRLSVAMTRQFQSVVSPRTQRRVIEQAFGDQRVICQLEPSRHAESVVQRASRALGRFDAAHDSDGALVRNKRRPPALTTLCVSLSRNELFGPLPSSVTALANLARLDLSYNDLEGDVAVLYLLPNLSALLFDHNPRLSGRSPLLRHHSSWQW